MGALWFGAWLLTSRTRFGRSLYAVGGSQRVARLSAINVPRTLLGAYVLSGLCSAPGGLFILAPPCVSDPITAHRLHFMPIFPSTPHSLHLSHSHCTLY